jgi:hypothetical protein
MLGPMVVEVVTLLEDEEVDEEVVEDVELDEVLVDVVEVDVLVKTNAA